MSGHGTGEADTPIAPFTPATYVRDNVIGLAAFLLALASTVLILPALGVNSAGTLLVADVLTLIALGAGFLDYRRKAAFYHELHHLTGQLRQACVLPSLIAEPPFLDGKIAYDTASRLAQLSAEETAALRDNEALSRRYVELWIHEIKTPIAAIKLMLANNPGPESAKVARELERIEAQVDQALYYARSTSVERDYAIREVNLADAAREACKRHSRFLIEKGCTPAFDIPDAMTVLADEPWLVFILGQVIVNAAKYGATTLTFTAREEEPGTSRGRTVLEVRDNGCGHSRRRRAPRLRARFHRSGRPRPRFGHGHGPLPGGEPVRLHGPACGPRQRGGHRHPRHPHLPPRPHPQGTLRRLEEAAR